MMQMQSVSYEKEPQGQSQVVPPMSWSCVLDLVLDIFCQQLGNTCQLNFYGGIGYILPTIEEYIAIGGCQCATTLLQNVKILIS